MEEFRDIPGYNGKYQVSNLGRVYFKTKERFCNLRNHNKGYLCVKLYRDGVEKSFLVHRLVALQFNMTQSTISDVVNRKIWKQVK